MRWVHDNPVPCHLVLRVKRIHDPPDPDDGARILVDRLWPRGVSKDRAALHQWAKHVAPSNELRQSFHADTDWHAFESRYRRELAEKDLSDLHALASQTHVTLLTAVKQPDRSHASVLRDVLMGL